MAKVQPRDYIVGIILFTFIIVGGVHLINAFYVAEPTYVDQDKFSEFNNTFNVYNEVTESVDDIEGSIISQDLPAPIEFIATMFLTAFQALMSLFTSLSFMDAVFSGLTGVFGIPSWIPTLILSLVTVMIVFSIVSAILQRDI
jgi:hypothetical protein